MTVKSSISVILDKKFNELELKFSEERNEISMNMMNAYKQLFRIRDEITNMGASAIPDLIEYALVNKNIDYQVPIISALGNMQSTKATSFLLKSLKSKDYLVRTYVAEALSQIKDPEAVDELLKALKKEKIARFEIYEAIYSCGDSNIHNKIYNSALNEENADIRRLAISNSSFETNKNHTIEMLSALHDEKMGIAKSAAHELKKVGPVIVPTLIKKLTQKGRHNRQISVDLLVHFKDQRAVLPLCEQLLKSRNKIVRKKIAYGLGKIKSEDSIPFLCEALKDQESEVRDSAARALGLIKSPAAIEPLRKLIYNHHTFSSIWERSNATTSIGKIKTNEANKVLIELLSFENDYDVRIKAAEHLAINKMVDAIEPLYDQLKPEKKADVRLALEISIYKLSVHKTKLDRKKKKISIDYKNDNKCPDDFEKDLNSQDFYIKLQALEYFEELSDHKYISSIEKLIFDFDDKIRKKTIQVLLKMDSRDTLTKLIKNIQNTTQIFLPLVIESIGLFKDPSAIDTLTPYLDSKQRHLRLIAKNALKNLQYSPDKLAHDELKIKIIKLINDRKKDDIIQIGEEAIAPLKEILYDYENYKYDTLLSYAVSSLLKLGWEPITIEEKVFREIFYIPSSEFNKVAKEGYDFLLKLLQIHPNDRIIKGLIVSGDKAIDVLISCFGSDNYQLRDAASSTLMQYGKYPVDSIIDLLKSPNMSARATAAKFLSEIKESKAIDTLIDQLKYLCTEESTNEHEPGFSTTQALGKLKNKKAIPVLVEALNSNKQWRRGAVMALGEIGSKEASFALKNALKDKNYDVQWNASKALEKIGVEPENDKDKALLALVTNDHATIWNHASLIIPELVDKIERFQGSSPNIKALANTGDERAVEAICKNIGNPSSDKCKTAVEVTQKFGKKALPHLLKLAESHSEKAQINASKLLGKIKDTIAVDPLLKILNTRQGITQRAAAEALGKLQAKEAVNPLLKLLNNKSPETIKVAADALGKIKDKKAVKPLIKILKYDSPITQKAVIIALGKLKSPEAIKPLEKLVLKDYKIRLRRNDIVKKLLKEKNKKVLNKKK